MSDRICPLDGKPCEKDCPDRFHDTPDGGCLLTMAQDMGGNVMTIEELGGGQYALNRLN